MGLIRFVFRLQKGGPHRPRCHSAARLAFPDTYVQFKLLGHKCAPLPFKQSAQRQPHLDGDVDSHTESFPIKRL